MTDFYSKAASCPYVKQMVSACPWMSNQIAQCPYLKSLFSPEPTESVQATHTTAQGHQEQEPNYSVPPPGPITKEVNASGHMVPSLEDQQQYQ